MARLISLLIVVISFVDEMKRIWLVAIKTVFPLYNNRKKFISELKCLVKGSLP
jgi:hypothetical protein